VRIAITADALAMAKVEGLDQDSRTRCPQRKIASTAGHSGKAVRQPPRRFPTRSRITPANR